MNGTPKKRTDPSWLYLSRCSDDQLSLLASYTACRDRQMRCCWYLHRVIALVYLSLTLRLTSPSSLTSTESTYVPSILMKSRDKGLSPTRSNFLFYSIDLKATLRPQTFDVKPYSNCSHRPYYSFASQAPNDALTCISPLYSILTIASLRFPGSGLVV